MTRLQSTSTCLLVFALGLGAGPAYADSQDSAAADALFREGRALYEAKRYGEACPKFAESYRLDPASGSAVALAACHESQGKLASAWAAYNEAAARAKREGQPERAEAARKRATELEPKLARMNVSLATGSQDMNVTVKRDDVTLGSASLGTPLPVDAGVHVIEATAPRRKPFTMRVTVTDGGVQSITIPPLQAADEGAAPAPAAPVPASAPPPVASAPPPAAPPPPPTSPTPPPAPPQPASRSTGSTTSTLGLVAAGAGVVTMGAGGFFGIEALSKNSDSNANGHCVDDVCDPVGKKARQDARSAGDLSTILFAVGGGLTATGIVLFLVSGPSKDAPKSAGFLRIAPIVTPTSAGAALGGTL